MSQSRFRLVMLIAAALLASNPGAVRAQVCSVSDSVRRATPDTTPARSNTSAGISAISLDLAPLGIGHVHYSDANAPTDLAPGEDDWLRRVELPLSRTPDAEPAAWLVRGWIMIPGEPPQVLTTTGLIETGYENSSFLVDENRPRGWLLLRLAEGAAADAFGWVPRCALSNSPARLSFTPWNEWFLSKGISPLFFRSNAPGELRSGPSPTSALASRITGDYVLEPLEIRGEWMRVILKQPSDYCSPQVVPTRGEGWVRWYSMEKGPLVWYFTRGC
jgi:hypothetical protein